jgi:hypothetical protein
MQEEESSLILLATEHPTRSSLDVGGSLSTVALPKKLCMWLLYSPNMTRGSIFFIMNCEASVSVYVCIRPAAAGKKGEFGHSEICRMGVERIEWRQVEPNAKAVAVTRDETKVKVDENTIG